MMKRTKSFLIICCSAAVVTWLPISASTAGKSESIYVGQKLLEIEPQTVLVWNNDAIETSLLASIDTLGDDQGYKADVIKKLHKIRGKMTLKDYYDLNLIEREKLLEAMSTLPETFSYLRMKNSKLRYAMYQSLVPALQTKDTDMGTSSFVNATSAYLLANGVTKNSPEVRTIFGSLYPNYNDVIVDYTNKPKSNELSPDGLIMEDILTGFYLTSSNFSEKTRRIISNVFKLTKNKGYIPLDNLPLLEPSSLIAVVKTTERIPRSRDSFTHMQPKIRADLLDKISKFPDMSSNERIDAFSAVTILIEGTRITTLEKNLPRKTFKQLKELTAASLKSIPNEQIDPIIKLRLSNAILVNPFVTDKKSKEMALESIIEMVKKNKDITEPDSEFVFEISKSFKNISTEPLQHLNDAIVQLPVAYQSKLRKAGIPAPKHDGSTIDLERTDKRELR